MYAFIARACFWYARFDFALRRRAATILRAAARSAASTFSSGMRLLMPCRCTPFELYHAQWRHAMSTCRLTEAYAAITDDIRCQARSSSAQAARWQQWLLPQLVVRQQTLQRPRCCRRVIRRCRREIRWRVERPYKAGAFAPRWRRCYRGGSDAVVARALLMRDDVQCHGTVNEMVLMVHSAPLS